MSILIENIPGTHLLFAASHFGLFVSIKHDSAVPHRHLFVVRLHVSPVFVQSVSESQNAKGTQLLLAASHFGLFVSIKHDSAVPHWQFFEFALHVSPSFVQSVSESQGLVSQN